MKEIFILSLVLLTACGEGPVRKSFDLEEVTVRWIRGWPAGPERGSAKIDPGNKRCTIEAPEPEHQYDEWAERIMGHEIFHCFYGEYHDDILAHRQAWRF